MEANYFTILYWFCHTSTWIHHGCTHVPHPEPPPTSLPSGSSQCTSPKHPVSCIEPGLVIHFLYDIIYVSMPFSQISPPSPSPTGIFHATVAELNRCYRNCRIHKTKSLSSESFREKLWQLDTVMLQNFFKDFPSIKKKRLAKHYKNILWATININVTQERDMPLCPCSHKTILITTLSTEQRKKNLFVFSLFQKCFTVDITRVVVSTLTL